MGSDVSRLDVSLIMQGKVRRQCPKTTICEEEGEPPRRGVEPGPFRRLPPSRAPLPLGQAGSPTGPKWPPLFKDTEGQQTPRGKGVACGVTRDNLSLTT